MPNLRDRFRSMMHLYHARAVSRMKPVTAFRSQPEPKTVGSHLRGRQIVAGNFLFSGVLVEGQGQSIWSVAEQNVVVAPEIHGCAWLDDVMAIGDLKARSLAQEWVYDWIARYGNGTGVGWSPDLTGRRLVRLISHGFVFLRGRPKSDTDAFFQSLARQAIFLSRRWASMTPGLARFEALSGMIYAGLSLEGMDRFMGRAVQALASDCDTQIQADGGTYSRNPQELLDILVYLIWVRDALHQSELEVPSPLEAAIERIVPVLRVLRHEDGTLARFHGGGRGLDGRLDYALAESKVAARGTPQFAMGYIRMRAGRSTLIADATAPSKLGGVEPAHASTLAFELTSGRRPLVVNCGSGRPFGPRWQKLGRSTQGHSTLQLQGMSSSVCRSSHRAMHVGQFDHCPDHVQSVLNPVYQGRRVELSHNGYQRDYGLTHARTLDLSLDGRSLVGEDMVTSLHADDRLRFDRSLLHDQTGGLPLNVRFHLHPDVEALVDMGGRAVSLGLKSGDIWIFRHDGSAKLSLESSVYFDKGRLNPRETQQIVLSARTTSYITRVCWSFAKAQDTPMYTQDLVWNDVAAF